MVVYGPPITHLPPPAVGASPDAAIHDFKGSCRRSVRITVGRSLPWIGLLLFFVCWIAHPYVCGEVVWFLFLINLSVKFKPSLQRGAAIDTNRHSHRQPKPNRCHTRKNGTTVYLICRALQPSPTPRTWRNGHAFACPMAMQRAGGRRRDRRALGGRAHWRFFPFFLPCLPFEAVLRSVAAATLSADPAGSGLSAPPDICSHAWSA